MPTILRKSLTACEALAALPPTPRMNSRPPRARAWSRCMAIRSMASTSRPSITCLASAKKLAACDMILLGRRAPVSRGIVTRPGDVRVSSSPATEPIS